MDELDNLFKPLLQAMDTFFDLEEKKVGCLNNAEHQTFMKLYNYIDCIYMKKKNADIISEEKSKFMQTISNLLYISDGFEKEGLNKELYHKKMEFHL